MTTQGDGHSSSMKFLVGLASSDVKVVAENCFDSPGAGQPAVAVDMPELVEGCACDIASHDGIAIAAHVAQVKTMWSPQAAAAYCPRSVRLKTLGARCAPACIPCGEVPDHSRRSSLPGSLLKAPRKGAFKSDETSRLASTNLAPSLFALSWFKSTFLLRQRH